MGTRSECGRNDPGAAQRGRKAHGSDVVQLQACETGGCESEGEDEDEGESTLARGALRGGMGCGGSRCAMVEVAVAVQVPDEDAASAQVAPSSSAVQLSNKAHSLQGARKRPSTLRAAGCSRRAGGQEMGAMVSLQRARA
ncbi:hypothetical protein PMIN02_010629 [Paraphaeosphaeria minitans]